MQFDSENVKKAFLSWLNVHDSFIDDPLNYWKTNMTATITFNNEAIKMKELCSIAIRILVLPGSEAICERCFSQLKLIHSHLRSSLKSDILDCLLRIKLNLLWENEMTEMDSIGYDYEEEEEEEDEEDEENTEDNE